MRVTMALIFLMALGVAWGVAAVAEEDADARPDVTAPDEAPDLPEPSLHMVAMRDGTLLATDVYVPEEGEGPFPVLLARTVYGRAGLQMWAVAAMGRGYAFVAQDCRGRGDSEGKDRIFRDDGWNERQDGADTVAWVLDQSWCNGKLGTMGGSALGIVQAMMAPATDDVAAQSLGVAASDFYEQLAYQGGVFRKSLIEKWSEMQKSGYIVDVWHGHPTKDGFWQGYNADARAGDITAPGLHIGG